MKKIFLVANILLFSCLPMAKNIGYIELNQNQNVGNNNITDSKKFKHCNVYPNILENALEDFKKTTGKSKFDNIQLEISGLLFIPCVNIYYQ